MVFIARFIAKDGPQGVAESVDKVQPGLFIMILQSVSFLYVALHRWLLPHEAVVCDSAYVWLVNAGDVRLLKKNQLLLGR